MNSDDYMPKMTQDQFEKEVDEIINGSVARIDLVPTPKRADLLAELNTILKNVK